MIDFIYTNFAVVHDELDACPPDPVSPEAARPIETSSLSAAKLFLFRSHFRLGSIFLEKLYPEFFEDERFHAILFVDEPMRLAAVTYYHLSRQPSADLPATFGGFLKTRRNPMAMFLGVRPDGIATTLERYRMVGVNEWSSESLRAMIAGLREVLERAEVTPSVARSLYQVKRWLPPTADAEREAEIAGMIASVGVFARWRFRRANRVDRAIYEAAMERLIGGAR
jgi:hypothetical protein